MRRSLARGVIGVLVAMTTIVVIGTAGTAAVNAKTTIDAVCGPLGELKMKPAATSVPQPLTIKVSGALQDCSGELGPGSIAGALHSPSAYCDVNGIIEGSAATGRLTVTWGDASTSVLKVNVSNVSEGRGLFFLQLTGRVLSGRFVGDHVFMHGETSVASNQSCGSGISSETFDVGDQVPRERPLTLTHHA